MRLFCLLALHCLLPFPSFVQGPASRVVNLRTYKMSIFHGRSKIINTGDIDADVNDDGDSDNGNDDDHDDKKLQENTEPGITFDWCHPR